MKVKYKNSILGMRDYESTAEIWSDIQFLDTLIKNSEKVYKRDLKKAYQAYDKWSKNMKVKYKNAVLGVRVYACTTEIMSDMEFLETLITNLKKVYKRDLKLAYKVLDKFKKEHGSTTLTGKFNICLLYTSPSPRDS